MFDQWHGEGDLILKDFNNDSVLDIFHLTTIYLSRYPVNIMELIFISTIMGYFEIYDTENKIPYCELAQLEGYGTFFDKNLHRCTGLVKCCLSN